MVSRVLFIPSTSWDNPLHLLYITAGFAVLDVHSLLTTNFTTFLFAFLLLIAYCDELVSKIIQICSMNDYHYVTNFEW